jgi:hypothetical protein
LSPQSDKTKSLKINDLGNSGKNLSLFPDKIPGIVTEPSQFNYFPKEITLQSLDFKQFLRPGTAIAKDKVRPRRFH